ncbi:hypothetical protein DXG03_001581 [Asterophora parasitica]|uniref:Major facilitator superfamily (MFS) profile domain-containing protein n=1 Tax=Asterophora parasitica TaxID=117018 RepID=A0A9P7G4T1_9AGAR|nr:hypothetical protein DXG03_001581 [Asterophora parasitica]
MSINEKDEKTIRLSTDTESQASSDRNMDFFVTEGVDRAYGLKCDLINKCMQEEIGFGRYQIQLFILSGLGWMADNIWLQGVAVVLGQVEQELLPVRVEFATLALYVGLILGATVWGVMADIIGRRLSFNWTLTLLSGWWAIGQLVASVIAWGFIGNFSCDGETPVGQCFKADNMGWRYTIYTLGAMTFLMFILRFVVFDLQESSKYYIAKGRDEDAIAVLNHIAKRNGKTISLTIEKFRAVEGGKVYVPKSKSETIKGAFTGFDLYVIQVKSPQNGVINISIRSLVKPLFAGRKLAINSSITFMLWGLIGLAYPLFNSFLPLYLKERVSSSAGVSETYRNYAIISVCGIPGSLIACAVVDYTRGSNSKWSVGGRKLTMAISTLLTGVFLFLFTTSRNEAAVLGFSCASGLTQNAMYGVLFAYTPEVFPAPQRGTGDAIASSFNRITGILAPVIKIATTTVAGVAASRASANGAAVYVLSAATRRQEELLCKKRWSLDNDLMSTNQRRSYASTPPPSGQLPPDPPPKKPDPNTPLYVALGAVALAGAYYYYNRPGEVANAKEKARKEEEELEQRARDAAQSVKTRADDAVKKVSGK